MKRFGSPAPGRQCSQRAVYAASSVAHAAAGRPDSGGLHDLVVAYGSCFLLVMPSDGGHVSVAIERSTTPSDLVEPIRQAMRSAASGATT